MKNNDRLNKFKELVKEGYSREQIAVSMCITRRTILNYEKNIKAPNSNVFIPLKLDAIHS